MRFALVLLSLVLASCGGRVANPVALESGFDDRLSCAHLSGEYQNNIKRLAELTGEGEDKSSNNAGLLISNPLFLDFSGTLKREAEAILARNDRLLTLMAEKDCPGAASVESEPAGS
jgi:hypothetical protein